MAKSSAEKVAARAASLVAAASNSVYLFMRCGRLFDHGQGVLCRTNPSGKRVVDPWNHDPGPRLSLADLLALADDRLDLKLLLHVDGQEIRDLRGIEDSRAQTELQAAMQWSVEKSWQTRLRYVDWYQEPHLLIVDRAVGLVSEPSTEWVPGHTYVVTESAEMSDILATFDRSWTEGTVARLVYRGALEDADIVRQRKILVVSQEKWDRIMRDLARSPEKMRTMGHRDFEEFVAELLKERGIRTKLTPRTRDGGYDVLAFLDSVMGEHLFLVECKRYSPDRPVGVSLVRQLYGIVEQKRAAAGLLVTTSYFTREAVRFREQVRPRLSLADYWDIVQWLRS